MGAAIPAARRLAGASLAGVRSGGRDVDDYAAADSLEGLRQLADAALVVGVGQLADGRRAGAEPAGQLRLGPRAVEPARGCPPTLGSAGRGRDRIPGSRRLRVARPWGRREPAPGAPGVRCRRGLGEGPNRVRGPRPGHRVTQLVDDQLLGELLRGGDPPRSEEKVYTTGYWYVRLCQAVLRASERTGALSRPFVGQSPAIRERAIRRLVELPDEIGLESLGEDTGAPDRAPAPPTPSQRPRHRGARRCRPPGGHRLPVGSLPTARTSAAGRGTTSRGDRIAARNTRSHHPYETCARPAIAGDTVASRP